MATASIYLMAPPPRKKSPSGSNGITNTIQSPTGFPKVSAPTKVKIQTPIEPEIDAPDFSFLMTVSTKNCYFLQRALESLRIQFWANSELIAVCDHTDLVDEITEFLVDNRMRGRAYLCEIGKTRTEKFRTCVDQAKGSWLVVFDCDDILPTGAINTLDRCLKTCPDASYFTSDQAHIDTKNAHLKTMEADPRENTLTAIRNCFRQKHLWGFKRGELALFSDALNCNYPCEDYWFFTAMAMKGKMPLCIPFVLCCYRRHSMQMTQRQQESMAEMVDSIRGKIDRFLGKTDPMFLIHQENLVMERIREIELMKKAVQVFAST